MATRIISKSRKRIGLGPQSQHVLKDGAFVERDNWDNRVIFLDSTDDDLVEKEAKRLGQKVERFGRDRELTPAQAKWLKSDPTFAKVGDKLGLSLVG